MVNQPQKCQTLLFYHSCASVLEIFLGMIERSAGAVPPDGWPENRPFYLKKDIETIEEVFGEAIENALAEVEISSNSELQTAARILEYLDSQPETLHNLNTLRIVAIERCKEGLSGGQINDAG